MFTKVKNTNQLLEVLDKIKEDSHIILEEGVYELEEKILLENLNNITLEGEGKVIISGASKQFKKDTYPNSIFVNGQRRLKSTGYTVPVQAWNKCVREDFVPYNLLEDFEGTPIYAGFLTNIDKLKEEKPENIEFVFNVGWTQSMCNGYSSKIINDQLFLMPRRDKFVELQKKKVTPVGAPTELRNLRSQLKEGSFYHDKSGNMIEYLPTKEEKENGYEILYPHLEELLSIKDSSNVKIKNIQFSYTTWKYPSRYGFNEIQSTTFEDYITEDRFNIPKASVSVEYSKDISFESCEFSNLGATAIHLARGCKNNSIKNCTIHSIAGGGIIVGHFEDKDAHPEDEKEINFNTLIENNKIYDIGLIHNGACGVLAGYVNSVKIYNNLIYNIAYTGISVGWGWTSIDPAGNLTYHADLKVHYKEPSILKKNHIKGNEIHHVMTKMHDGAGIYTLSNQDGSIIEDNYIHDNGESKEEPIEKIYVKKSYLIGVTTKWGYISKRKGFPGGIYLDEGSAGFTVRNNKIERVACNYYYHDTGIPGIFETNNYDVEKLDNPILSFD